MTADLFDRYIWLSIILAKFNLQYHLCSPFLWKMGSFQYVGPGYKACLSKLSQSFFIIFPPDVLSYRTCSASACLCYLFALMIFCLHTYDSGIKSYATKKISISDRSKNGPLMKPRTFPHFGEVGQQQCMWSTASEHPEQQRCFKSGKKHPRWSHFCSFK